MNTVPNSCPWAKLSQAPIVHSLNEVMSEQLALDLNEQEFKFMDSKITPASQMQSKDQESVIPLGILEKSSITDNDLILAQLLQLEFDKEYDDILKSREVQKNKNSSISISYEKFKSVHPIDAKEETELNFLTKEEVVTSSDSEDGKQKK